MHTTIVFFGRPIIVYNRQRQSGEIDEIFIIIQHFIYLYTVEFSLEYYSETCLNWTSSGLKFLVGFVLKKVKNHKFTKLTAW